MPRTVQELLAQLYDGPVPDSPEASYRMAASSAPIPEAPEWLGTVRPIAVMRAGPVEGGTPSDKDLQKALQPRQLREMDDEEESEESKILKLFDAPVKNPLAGM